MTAAAAARILVVTTSPMMRGMTGFEPIPLIRAIDADIAIVAYTAVAGDFVRQAMARESVPLVLKSGDVEPLVAALETALRSA